MTKAAARKRLKEAMTKIHAVGFRSNELGLSKAHTANLMKASDLLWNIQKGPLK
jgi:hypothetical protein